MRVSNAFDIERRLSNCQGESLEQAIDSALYYWRLLQTASIRAEFVELIATCRILDVDILRLLEIDAANRLFKEGLDDDSGS